MSMTMAVWAVNPGLRERLEAELESGRGLASLQGAPCCGLEKAWSAIQFILTGTAYEGDLPAAFLLHGGELLLQPDDELDSVPRWISTTTVQPISAALEAIGDDELLRRCDVAAMVAADVYSVSTDYEEDLMEELRTCFPELKQACFHGSAK